MALEYVQFPIICSLQYSININTVEVDTHSELLHICIVKPKNTAVSMDHFPIRQTFELAQLDRAS